MRVALKKTVFDAEMRMQTWRWTELQQLLEVTTTGSHSGSQAFTRNVYIFILSAAEIFPILSAMSNQRIMFEKKNCLFGLHN